jgi:hypothetical protein
MYMDEWDMDELTLLWGTRLDLFVSYGMQIDLWSECRKGLLVTLS